MKFVYTFELLLEEEACLGRHGGEKVRELTRALRLRATSEEREKEGKKKRKANRDLYIKL